MSWVAPMTATAHAALTAAQWNLNLRGNMLELCPARATAAGGYFVSTGAHEVVNRSAVSDGVEVPEATLDTAPNDLITIGPQVSVETGAKALIFLSAQIEATPDKNAYMSVAVSGASSIAASAGLRALMIKFQNEQARIRHGVFILQSGMTTGVNTFTAKYWVESGGVAIFGSRYMLVMPF